MTAQVSERLFYDRKAVSLRSTPLTPYLQQSGQAGIFQMTNTANWRGYVGTWEIVGDRLYLVALSGRMKDGSPASLLAVFPDASDRVFAQWYTGTLSIPDGELVQYVHVGFASRYDRDILLEVKDGVVVLRRLRSNESIPRAAAEE